MVTALAFHQCGPGSIPGPGVTCGLSLLALYSAPRGFSPGTPVFPSPQKPTFDLIDLIYLIYSCFDEEQGLRDICVTFESLFRLILHFFFSVIDYID